MSKSSNYDYDSEARYEIKFERASGSRRKKANKKLQRSKRLGIFMAVLQLLLSVAFIGLLVYKNLSFITLPITIGIGVVLLLLHVIVIIMQTKSLGVKRAGKVICALIMALLIALMYLIYPLDKMSGKSISEDPFVVFVSASDTFGELSDDNAPGRSDTNILAVVNPRTHTVALISTPRDYYVEITADDVVPNSYDKLTHCGLYGNGNPTEPQSWIWGYEVAWQPGYTVLMETLSNMYDIQIDGKPLNRDSDNYHYVRVNFTGFANLIDALGGITVNVDEGFTTHTYADYTTGEGRTDYVYTEGDMEMDGATALTYARERHSFATGDIQRNKNQVKVINAMIKKLLSGHTLLNYGKIVDSIETSFTTDMDISSIVSLQTQVARHSDYNGWNIVSYNVTGPNSDTYQLCTYNGKYLSVVMQDEESISNAQTIIQMVLGGEDSTSIQTYVDGLN